MLVDNPIDRYSVSDRTAGLAYEADWGLGIQHLQPADASTRANWLPAPDGRFYLCLRAYSPRAKLIDGRLALPPIARILISAVG